MKTGSRQESAKPFVVLSRLFGLQATETQPTAQRKHYLNISISIAFPATLAFALFNFLTGFPTLGLIELAAALFPLSAAFYLLNSSRRLALAENLTVFYGVVVTLALTLFGGVDGSGVLWNAAFPFLAFLIKGQRHGWLACGLWASIMLFLLLLFSHQGWAYPYSGPYILQIVLAMVFFSFMAAAFNQVREDFEQRLSHKVKERTEKARLYLDKLQFWALHDRATELPNRNYLVDHITSILDEGAPEGCKHFAVASIKVKRFIELSSIMGSDGGDTLSRAIAKVLVQQFGKLGLVANHRPDEFFVAFWVQGQPPSAAYFDQQFGQLSMNFKVLDLEVHLDCMTGVAFTPEHAQTADELLIRAEDAMRQADLLPTGHVALFDEAERLHFLRRHDLYNRLKEALSANKLSLFYQPKVDLKTGRIVGVEALARWKDQQEGFISPAEFIPIAENSGMMKPLTEWVIRDGIKQARDWQQAGIEVKISLNLSVRNILDPELIPLLKETIKTYGVNPATIVLEITETSFTDSKDTLYGIVDQLSDLGFKLSIDDFGTGYSSFSYLKDLNVHELKIDQVFVRELEKDSRCQNIVQTIVQIAHGLGLRVVTEGVEKAEQAELLRRYGSELAQGYFYSRPLPVNEFEALYRRFNEVRE